VKRLVDIDEPALAAAREHLGTATIKDTVNAALRLAAGRTQQGVDIDDALQVLASTPLSDRAEAWR
jgi:hypothetical protein